MELSNKNYDNPYKYNGKEFDSQTGLYYYGARYYDPPRSLWLSVDPLVEITMSPYAYTWNDPVNYTDPTGMIGERIGDPGGPNPDSFWHTLTWSKAHRNAQRYANNMQFGGNSVNMYKHNDGDYSVDTNFGNGLHNKATFSRQGEVYNKDYRISVGDGQGQNEVSNTVTNYPAPDFNAPTIKSPSDNPYANPSSQLAYTTLIAMQEAPFIIAPELIPAKYANMARSIVYSPIRQLTRGLIEICFTKGTLVATERGNKNIEEIHENDLVWSYNQETGKKELKKVLKLSENISTSLVKVKIGTTEILCTPEHPFYVNGDWIEAKKLTKGMLLINSDGNISVVGSIDFLDEKVKVYNFEVEDNHNYYVSEKEILVHNSCLNWLSKARNLKVIRSGCEVVADRAVKSLGEGAEYLQIKPRFGNQLGNVAGENSGWSWHVAAFKDGMVYDRLTGSAGMRIENYKQLFEYHTDLLFEVVSKRTVK